MAFLALLYTLQLLSELLLLEVEGSLEGVICLFSFIGVFLQGLVVAQQSLGGVNEEFSISWSWRAPEYPLRV